MSRLPKVTLVAAVSEDGFISRGTGVPWNLPDDIAHFRERTAGRWLLIGRRTWSEMLGWFIDHRPLVLSHDPGFHPQTGQRVSSVSEALHLATAAGVDELVVVGGGMVFAAALPHADVLDLTLVHTKLGQGVPFPAIDPAEWRQVTKKPHPADARHGVAFAFTEWHRVPAKGSGV